MLARLFIFNRIPKRVDYNNFYIKFNPNSCRNDKVRFFHVSEKIKGTFLQNWLNYWKSVYFDYKEVAINIVKESKEHPIKATFYALCGTSIYYGVKHNPNEVAFQEQLINSSLKILQVGELVRNPISSCYVKWLQQCYNEGILNRLNFGILSVMWLNDYDKECTVYKSVCPYLKPEYATFYHRIVDVGFLDIWWVLNNSMIDYDINDSEYV